MSQIISSFQRVEAKYFLTPAQKEALTPALEAHFTVDGYGKHTISNLYYDTEHFEILRASIEKPVYKEKLRLRAYGQPVTEESQVFLELKKKYDHVVYKRRVAAPLPEILDFLQGGPQPEGTDPQIDRELRRFLELYQPKPRIYLSYDRIAMFGKEDPELRITLDRNLRWRDQDLDLRLGTAGEPLVREDLTLMEIKIPGVMPLWLAHALSQAEVFQTSFSKVGCCYTHCILPKYFSEKVVVNHV